MFSATVKGVERIIKEVKKDEARTEKALNTAIRIEGFRLMRLLRKQIKVGAPGGRKFAPWRFISRWGSKKIKSKFRRGNPLGRLGGKNITYRISNKRPFEMRIGWAGTRVSEKIKKIAAKQQAGFTTPVTDEMRRLLRLRGAWRKEVEGDLPAGMGVAKFHFLRKSTTRFVTPARQIIDPFWQTSERRAWRNIKRNFRRKMAGERI